MYLQRRAILLAALLASGMLSCRRPSQSSASPIQEDFQTVRAPASQVGDDVGRFLAGMPGRPGSPFAELESKDAWTSHRKESDAEWDPVLTRWLPPMREFQEKELGSAVIRDNLVFYPFSGPDALA